MNIRLNFENNIKTIMTQLSTEMGNLNFYFNHAPKSATKSYVVVRVEDITEMSPTYRATVKFAIYDDRNASSTENTKKADIIRNKLNWKSLNFTNMNVHATLSLEQTIPSEFLDDKQVIEQQFDMDIYIKGE